MALEQWRAQAPWSLGVGWRLVQAYLRPGRDPGMQGAISTFLSSKEIPPRGEVGGGESARCLPPSVCPGLTQPPLLPLREGQIFSDCPPPAPRVSSVRRALPPQDAFCLGMRWGCRPQLRRSQQPPLHPCLFLSGPLPLCSPVVCREAQQEPPATSSPLLGLLRGLGSIRGSLT